jgi:hypothetical protein
MSFYSLQTKMINNQTVSQHICNVVNNTEVCEWITRNIPDATEVRDFLEQTPIDLADIINARLDRLDKARSSTSLSFNEPDYLSSAFLERGLRCSAAVCLLKRGFWIEDLIDLIKDRLVKDLPEILRELSAIIGLFDQKSPGGSQDVWKDYNRVADALEQPRIKELLGQFRDKLKKLSCEEKQRQGTVVIPFATGFLVGKNYLLTNFRDTDMRDCEAFRNT